MRDDMLFRTAKDRHVYPLATHKSQHRYYTDRRKPKTASEAMDKLDDVEDIESQARTHLNPHWEEEPVHRVWLEAVCRECGWTTKPTWWETELEEEVQNHIDESGHEDIRVDRVNPTFGTDERPRIVFPFFTDRKGRVHEFDEVEYDPEKFPGLVYRFGDHRATATIFPNGKTVVVGATSERQGRELVRELAEKLRERGLPLEEPKVSTESVVMTSSLGPLNLEDVNRQLEPDTED